MSDLLQSYKEGLAYLIGMLSKQEEEYSDACIFQQRLLENIEKMKHGNTEILSHERSEIIAALNPIAEQLAGKSFIEFCELFSDSKVKENIHLPPEEVLNSVDKYLTSLLEKAHKLKGRLENPESLYPEECDALKNAFQLFNGPFQIGTTTLIQKSTKLSFINEQLKALMSQLDVFCPECYKSMRSIKKQRQDVYKALEALIQLIET